MFKFIKIIIALGILLALVYHVTTHWDDLRLLWNLGPTEIIAVFASCFILVALNARLLQVVVRVLGFHCDFMTMFSLEHAAQFLNYAPMKIGTLFRAHYLKKHYGLSYTSFLACFVYITLLMVACSCALALVALAWSYGFTSYESKVLFWVFLLGFFLSTLILIYPLPKPTGGGRLCKWLQLLLSGREQLGQSNQVLVASTGLLLLNFLVGALRIGIIYHGLGWSGPLAGYVILSSLSYISLFAGITPGALGIREAVMSLGAVLIGISLELGVLVALIDRAILIVYTFFLGGFYTLYLWRRSPKDFISI